MLWVARPLVSVGLESRLSKGCASASAAEKDVQRDPFDTLAEKVKISTVSFVEELTYSYMSGGRRGMGKAGRRVDVAA